MTTILVRVFSYHFVRASDEAISGTQRYFSAHVLAIFRISGMAILGKQRCLSLHFLIIFSRLRRGDFR